MLRLLIVDNEEIIVNHLFEVFRNMEQLELDVYKAYSGEEAIEWLHRTRIDIVLTDIDMPQMNGLQLMDEIFRRWPQCKIIFLTGHSEFSYVYKAIQHPDVSYVLKIEDIDRVIQVVEETVTKIHKEIKTGDLIREAKDNIQMALELFQEDYLIGLIKGNKFVQASNEQFEQLSVPLSFHSPVILVVGKLDDDLEDKTYMERIQHIYSVRQIIKRYLALQLRSVILVDDQIHFTLLIQPKEYNSLLTDENALFNETIHYLKGMLESIQQSCLDKLNHSISFTVKSTSVHWQHISKQYTDLHALLNYKIGSENSILLLDKEVKHKQNYNSSLDEAKTCQDAETKLFNLTSASVFTLLEQYLESGRKDKYFNELEQLLEQLSRINNRESIIAQQVICSIFSYLLAFINRWGLYEKVRAKIGELSLIHAYKADNWCDAASYIKEISLCVFELQKQEQKRRADHIISYIQDFIFDHLNEDLSLVRLSELVYLNPSYLSRIFKQETKRNLTEFIDTARIQKAKQLLRHENLKIHEIAKQVGYETATSFTRFFKNLTGFSPQDYRDKYNAKVK